MTFLTDITGGVKFFDKNLALFRDGNTAAASSNNAAGKYVLSPSKYTRWESLASNDVTTETITINFLNTTTIDRIVLQGHNFKSYSIKYNAALDFTTVSDLDADLVGGITQATYTNDTSYYAFDAVAVDSLTITINTTQIANAQKFLTQIIATTELGTLAGFPRISSVKHNRNVKAAKVISGKNVIQKGYETTTFKMGFRSYPVQADIDLIEALHEREDSFLVWLCGGRYGTDYFTISQRGWRLEDIYNMQVNKPLGANYSKGIYVNGVDTSIPLVEVV